MAEHHPRTTVEPVAELSSAYQYRLHLRDAADRSTPELQLYAAKLEEIQRNAERNGHSADASDAQQILGYLSFELTKRADEGLVALFDSESATADGAVVAEPATM